MKKFESPIQVGTKVNVSGYDGWYAIAAFENDRKLVKIAGLAGSFQREDIKHYSNRGSK